MNREFLARVIRENWYLLLAFVICVGVFSFKFASGPDETENITGPIRTAPPGAVTPERLEALRTTRTPAEKARETIEQHEAKLAQNPSSEEAPALLCAIGNLRRQRLGEMDEAIECYERVIRDYPESSLVRSAYINLAHAYEERDETHNARSVYQRMMQAFPEDSQEYLYASAKVAGKPTPGD